ncbi:MAG: DUF2142 domain-containing protein [Thermodesulfobacteriota bacterium]
MRPGPHASGRSIAAAAFLLIGAIYGTALGLLTPPLRWGDENTHFIQAYRLSELSLALRPALRGTYTELPRGVGRFLMGRAFELKKRRKTAPERLDALVRKLDIEANPHDRRLVKLDNATYPPLGYVPQAIGIAAARPFTRSVLLHFYAARLGNVVAWLLLVWAAIRTTPYFRLAFAVLALSPLSVFVASTCALDGTTNGLAFLWTAWIVRLATSETPARAPVVPLGVLAAALTLVKLAYAPLVLLLLAVPAERFGGARRRLLAVAAVLLASLAVTALWLLVARWQIAHTAAHLGARTASANLTRLLQDPLAVAAMVGDNLLLVVRHAFVLLVETIWFTSAVRPEAFPAWLAALLCAVFAEPRPDAWPALRDRAVAVATAIVTMIGVALIAFVLWTRAGASEISGVQSRYVIPLLPALTIAVSPPGSILPGDGTRRGLVVVALALVVAVLGYTVHRGMLLWR